MLAESGRPCVNEEARHAIEEPLQTLRSHAFVSHDLAHKLENIADRLEGITAEGPNKPGSAAPPMRSGLVGAVLDIVDLQNSANERLADAIARINAIV